MTVPQARVIKYGLHLHLYSADRLQSNVNSLVKKQKYAFILTGYNEHPVVQCCSCQTGTPFMTDLHFIQQSIMRRTLTVGMCDATLKFTPSDLRLEAWNCIWHLAPSPSLSSFYRIPQHAPLQATRNFVGAHSLRR